MFFASLEKSLDITLNITRKSIIYNSLYSKHFNNFSYLVLGCACCKINSMYSSQVTTLIETRRGSPVDNSQFTDKFYHLVKKEEKKEIIHVTCDM